MAQKRQESSWEPVKYGKLLANFSRISKQLYGKLKFGLVYLFNGISTFVGYLMPKPFSLKNSSGTI